MTQRCYAAPSFDELRDGFHNPVLAFRLKMRIHGEGDDLARKFLGYRKLAFSVSQPQVGILQMQWNGVVDPRTDVPMGEELAEAFSLPRADHVEVIDGANALWLERKRDGTSQRRHKLVISSGALPPLFVPIGQVRQFDV